MSRALMTARRIAALIRFAGVPRADLEALVRLGRLRRFRVGQCLVDHTRGRAPLYLVIEGRVELGRTHPDLIGAIPAGDLCAGEVVGALDAADPWYRRYVAFAAEPTTTLDLSAAPARLALGLLLADSRP